MRVFLTLCAGGMYQCVSRYLNELLLKNDQPRVFDLLCPLRGVRLSQMLLKPNARLHGRRLALMPLLQ